MIPSVARALLGPWGWAALAAATVASVAAVLGAGEIAVRRSRRRNDMQWAAEVAERVRIAEVLARMERDLAGTDLEVLAALMNEKGQT